MGIVIRRSGYTAVLSYLGFFIGYVNMLWLFPFVFSPEEIDDWGIDPNAVASSFIHYEPVACAPQNGRWLLGRIPGK